MEESVYLVDRILGSATPVVFTGAQRGADVKDADGPRNLRDAIRVADSRETRGLGASWSSRAKSTRRATPVRSHTSALRAFDSPGYGPIGHVDARPSSCGGRPFGHRRCGCPGGCHRRPPPPVRGERRPLHPSFARTGAEAVVIEGTGRGNANEQVIEAVREATGTRSAGRDLLTLCERSRRARLRPGGGRDLEEAGALFAGDLAGPKVRVLSAARARWRRLDAPTTLAAESGDAQACRARARPRSLWPPRWPRRRSRRRRRTRSRRLEPCRARRPTRRSPSIRGTPVLLAGSNSLLEGAERVYSSTDGGLTWSDGDGHAAGRRRHVRPVPPIRASRSTGRAGSTSRSIGRPPAVRCAVARLRREPRRAGGEPGRRRCSSPRSARRASTTSRRSPSTPHRPALTSAASTSLGARLAPGRLLDRPQPLRRSRPHVVAPRQGQPRR